MNNYSPKMKKYYEIDMRKKNVYAQTEMIILRIQDSI